MKTIHKITLHKSVYTIPLPVGSVPLTAQIQHGEVVVWYETTSSKDGEFKDERFIMLNTGEDMPDNKFRYLGTVQFMNGTIVKHIYHVEEW